MALLNDEARAELPEDVVAEVDGAEGREPDDGEAEPAPVRMRLSRRQKEQEERETRMAAIEARLAEANSARESEAQRYREELQQTRAELMRLAQAREASAKEREEDSTPIADKIERQRKKAQEALGKSDLDEYHRRMERIMDLKAEARVRAIPAPAQQQQQFAPQKPDWVRAVEFAYPEVLTHPNGQRITAQFEGIIDGPFGPDKLHKMFQRARAELGLAAPSQSNGASRQLHTGASTNGIGRASGGRGDRVVSVPKHFLAQAQKLGMTKEQAVKSWAESYPDEVER